MNRESLKNSGLLEQYVLGLTSREESRLVEQVLEDDPLAQQDYEELLREMEGLIEAQGLGTPDGNRSPRSIEEFEALDYEVAVEISRENHALSVWRYALGAITLLLILMCGYLYRMYADQRSELLTEKALHAQDRNSYQLKIKHSDSGNPDWKALETTKAEAVNGVVLLHHLKDQNLILLDLSHTDTLEDGFSYYVYVGEESKARLVIPREDRFHLHPISIEHDEETLKIFIWEEGQASPDQKLEKDMIADLSLPDPMKNASEAPR